MSKLRKWLSTTKIGYALGVRFTGTNKVAAVFSHKDFDRVVKGFFWINPLTETITDPIPCTMRVGTYHVPLLTKDNFAVKWHIKVQFIFDLQKASNPSVACNFTEEILRTIIGNKLQQTLSLHVPEFTIAELNTAKARVHLTRTTYQFITEKMKPIGIDVGADGIILGELDLPEAYRRIVEEEHRLNHLKTLLAADGELSSEDKMLLVFRSAKDQNPDFNLNSVVPAMMMMQNMATKSGNGNGHGNGHEHA